MAVALVPFVIAQPYAIGHLGKTWGSLINQGWRLLALTILIYFIGSALLRSREMYADVRASVWDGPRGALRRSLESLSPLARGRWRYLLGFHPDPFERCQLMDNTDRLFNISFWRAFGTGIAVTIAYTGFLNWLNLLTPSSLSLYSLDSLGAALVFAPLLVGIVGVSIWRTTFVQLAKGKPLYGAGRLGLGVGLGAILGRILNLFPVGPFSSTDILWYGLVLVSMALFFRWVGVGAAVWLDVAATKRTPRLIYTLGLSVAGVLLTLWFAFLYDSSPMGLSALNAFFLAPFSDVTLFGLVPLMALPDIFKLTPFILLVITPFTIIGYIILWGYPMAASFWGRQVIVSAGASWAYLDPSLKPLKWSNQGDLRLGLALVVGLISGLFFCILSFILSLGLQISFYSNVLPLELFVGWVVIWQAVLAAFIQAGAAAVTAAQVKRLGTLHGVFSSLVAAFVMVIGAIAIYVVFSGHPLSYYTQSFPYGTILGLSAAVINLGTCLALPTALGISLIAGWLRRSKPLRA